MFWSIFFNSLILIFTIIIVGWGISRLFDKRSNANKTTEAE
jgi:hypothetical protein